MYRPTNESERRNVLARTNNRCHLCNKSLCVNMYGEVGRRGSWEADHVRAQATGGTHHGNNILAACISCNRSKGAGSSSSYRKSKGLASKPSSTIKRNRNCFWNTVAGGATGALLGLKFGPIGAICGGVVGATVGCDVNPD